MAAVGVPHARRSAVLRRHILPEGAIARHAVVPAGPRGDRRGVARPPRRRRAAGRPGRRGDLADRIGDRRQRSRSPTRSRERAGCAAGSFDATWGGFGGAPKFPQPMTLEFLLRMAVRGTPGRARDGDDDPRSDGRRRDLRPVGGGFARYSTDAAWHVPHFEKMLYDNAQLAQLYTRAWLVTGEDRYRAGRDRDTRLPPPGDAPPGGRLLLVPGCGLRGRRGQVLRVDLGGARRAHRRPSCRRLRRHAGGQLGGHERAVAPGRLGAARPRARRRPDARSSRRGRRGSGRRPTTRCSPRGTRWRSRHSPRRAVRSGAPVHRGGRDCAALRPEGPSRARRAAPPLLARWGPGRAGFRRRPRAAGSAC